MERAPTVLAVGAHLKNSVALSVGDQVFVSQHIGDLETAQANAAFRGVINDFEKLYDARPEVIAADLHPDYLSTQFARTMSGKQIGVQHHVAHVLSCLAENETVLPALGIAWDGTGYGTDGTIWGGEFFLVTQNAVERVASLRPFRLPGGEAAVKEPRRVALGLIHQVCGAKVTECRGIPTIAAFLESELAGLKTMLDRKLNTPWCCSVGRLFDAVASLVNLRQQLNFEGQAAMELEFALDGIETDDHYHLSLITGKSPLLLDWSSMIGAIILDVKCGVPVGTISAKFHNGLVEAMVEVAKRIGEPRVALSGGCFQNRYLTERAVRRLRTEGFQPYWHQRVPPNDGGIALGQVVAARRELKGKC